MIVFRDKMFDKAGENMNDRAARQPAVDIVKLIAAMPSWLLFALVTALSLAAGILYHTLYTQWKKRKRVPT